VASGILDLIDPERPNPFQLPVFETIGDNMLDRVINISPGDLKLHRDAFPAQVLGPVSQKEIEGLGDRTFTIGPRQSLDHDSMVRALDAPGSVQKLNTVSPHGNKTESPHSQTVVARRWLLTFRAQALAVFSTVDTYDHGFAFQADLVFINKTLDWIAFIE
jgi:hypothetical protein